MSSDDPKFLGTPPVRQYKAAPTIAPSARAAAAVLEEARAQDGEENPTTFAVRVGAAYMGGSWSWDEQPYDGPLVPVDAGAVRLDVPRGWGNPQTNRGALVWSFDDDVVVILEVRTGWTMTPSHAEWVEISRRVAQKGWTVIAGRGVDHPHGALVEVAQARPEPPRMVRVSRTLFAPPIMAALHVSCPDAVPDALGAQLAAAAATLRPA